jgi:spoIIIJ-associated protein
MQNKANEVRVTAKTLDMALSQAANILQIDQSLVDYRVVSQGGGGLFAFLAKKIEIAAWKKDIDIDDILSDEGGEVEELSPAEVEALKKDLAQFCEGICSAICGRSVQVRADLDQGRLVLDCDDEYLASQMVKNSKLAEALEHILRKKPRHIRIFVDVQGVRRKRETDLVELARDLSEKVHENKRPIVLNYKSSYDRKIIHMALDKDERVYTKSIGTGPNRKLMILPIRKKDDQETGDER